MRRLDFGRGSIVKNIFAAALPMLVAQLINLLYNLIDRVYIGRIPNVGTEALGGIGLTFPIIIIITAFTNLYAGGGAPLFAIAMGEGKVVKAKRILRLCLWLELITAVLLIVVGEAFGEELLSLFGAGGEAMEYSLPYLRVYILGTLFSMIAIGLNPFINAQGLPLLGMLSVVIGAVLNLVLDPLFIFLFDMGVVGAATATVISQFISASIVIFALFRKVPITPTIPSWTEADSDGVTGLRLIWDIVSLGIASFVMQLTNALVSVACNAVLMRTGGHIYVSLMTIVASLRQVFETPLLAICEGTSPMISYNFGAGKMDRVRRSVKVMSVISLVYIFAIWLLIMVFPEAFIAIFSTDGEILTDAVSATRIYFCAFIFMTLQYIGQSTYKALNQRGRSVFFSILRKLILVVPLTYILPMFFNPPTDGVFAAEPVSNIIGGSASFITMLFFIRKL